MKKAIATLLSSACLFGGWCAYRLVWGLPLTLLRREVTASLQ